MNSNMSRRGIRFLVGLYLLFASVLVLSAAFSQRDYQDSWVLEGLFIQTLLLCLTFLIVVVNVRSSTKLVLLVASFLMLLSAVPNLKYIYPNYWSI